MREIIDQYGQTILAVIVAVAVMSAFYGLWTGQLSERVRSYEEGITTGRGNLGSAIAESDGTYHLSIVSSVAEEGLQTDECYAADSLFVLTDDLGNVCGTTGGLQIIRVYDLEENDVTAETQQMQGESACFCSHKAGGYRVRVRGNEVTGGDVIDGWFYLTVNDDEVDPEEEEAYT